MKFIYCLSILLFCWSCSQPTHFDQLIDENDHFDIAIMNGQIVDGTGAVARQADLLIRDGRVVFVGEVDKDRIKADDLIDAGGKVVSSGFIDVHVHGNPLSDTSFENFLASGTTTILLGQDGSHPSLRSIPYELTDWMDSLEQTSIELNVAIMAGHGSLRRQSEIPNQEEVSEAQMNSMLHHLEEALKAGSYGLSTGLEYVPGMYAGKEELKALAEMVGSYDAVMASHMRNEDDEAVEASIKELLELGEFCRVHASHLKVVYGKGAARGQEIIALLEEAKKAGKTVSADVYPYTASYTGIGIVFPAWAKTQEQFELAKQTRRKELEDFLQARITKRNGPEATLFGSGPYSGKTLAQAAQEKGISFVQLLMEIGPQGASGAYFIMDEALQDVFITHPEVMIASDGSPTGFHPRGHGTQTRIIERYVSEQRSISLEQAIYKMSGLPAQTMGIKDRGLIKEGAWADLLIFKPELVKEKATYSNPYQLSEGFDYVIVNGTMTRSQGKLLNKSAGKLLRKGKD